MQQAPPLQPVQRVAELFEALFNLERDVTAELLCELRRCSTADLQTLFGAGGFAVCWRDARRDVV
jgi:hypothetical protein